jgi:hypothetical protein
MSELINQTIHQTMEDLRGGRESWRVLLLLAIPAFAAGLAAGLMQLY